MGLATCVTCQAPIPPGRSALGYAYCLEPACVKANFKGTKIIAIGVSKSIPVLTTDQAGIPASYREAAAMALLGALSQDRVPITLPRVTGVGSPAPVSGTWVLP